MAKDQGALDQRIENMLQDGYGAAFSAAWMSDDDEPDESKRASTAWDKVKEQIPDMREVMIGVAAVAVGEAVDRAASILSDSGVVRDSAGAELTVSLSAGTTDSAQQQEIYVVQIVAGGDECEFCQGYDGRILHIDEESGMPPLHVGCQCDIEPLEPEKP